MYSVQPEEQIMDDYDCFLQEIESKVRDQGHNNKNYHRSADRLEQNKPLIKEYLVKHKWTIKDIDQQEWVTTGRG